jgi:hypothetical protein
MKMDELYQKAKELAGRTVEVEKTTDGKYIVLFLVLGKSPPPKGDTEREALEKFIEWGKDMPVHLSSLPEEDLHGNQEDHRPDPKDVMSEF